MNIENALKKSGLKFAADRHLFILGFNAKMKGTEKPIEDKSWNQDLVNMGWEYVEELRK